MGERAPSAWPAAATPWDEPSARRGGGRRLFKGEGEAKRQSVWKTVLGCVQPFWWHIWVNTEGYRDDYCSEKIRQLSLAEKTARRGPSLALGKQQPSHRTP